MWIYGSKRSRPARYLHVLGTYQVKQHKRILEMAFRIRSEGSLGGLSWPGSFPVGNIRKIICKYHRVGFREKRLKNNVHNFF